MPDGIWEFLVAVGALVSAGVLVAYPAGYALGKFVERPPEWASRVRNRLGAK